MTLGERIEAGRKALGLSQENLGERLGVSRQAVSKWEADAAIPETDKLIALSRLFGMTLDELLKIKKEPQARSDVEKDDPEGLQQTTNGNTQKRGWKGWLLFALAVLLVFLQGNKIVQLNTEIKALEALLQQTKEIVDFNLQFHNVMITAGDEAVHYSTDIALKLLFQPGSEAETVTFTALTGNGVIVTKEGERQGDYCYIATLSVPEAYPPLLINAAVQDSWGHKNTISLMKVEDYSPNGTYSAIPLWNNE